MKVTAILDIGKTNKKFFLFDKNYKKVYQSYLQFPEIKDDDGFPCDDLPKIVKWIKREVKKVLKNNKFELIAMNFSSYGASFVHIDHRGELVTPLYNYLKPIPKNITAKFYKKYGDKSIFSKETASPTLGMLNSGKQLFWLKYSKPKVFKKIKWSMHLPQYFSYLFSEIPLTEFTSIGCHTALWDYKIKDYHSWVYKEGLDQKFPPITATDTSINVDFGGKKIKVGVGVHDSSAALLPYLKVDKNPFLLVSTGTWSISINPFNDSPLTNQDLENDALNFLGIHGQPIKVARLFLGNEYKLQVKKLNKIFDKKKEYHHSVKVNKKILYKLKEHRKNLFHFESINLKRVQPKQTDHSIFPSFEIAYHQLMLELVALQIKSMKIALGKTDVKKIYIDGGFAANKIYVNLLKKHFKYIKFRTAKVPLGSALGAALLINDGKLDRTFLKNLSKKWVKPTLC